MYLSIYSFNRMTYFLLSCKFFPLVLEMTHPDPYFKFCFSHKYYKFILNFSKQTWAILLVLTHTKSMVHVLVPSYYIGSIDYLIHYNFFFSFFQYLTVDPYLFLYSFIDFILTCFFGKLT